MTSNPSDLPAGVITVPDYEPLARAVMTDNAWAYISGGGADELTMRWNREAFDRIRLAGRVLADLSSAHTRSTLLATNSTTRSFSLRPRISVWFIRTVNWPPSRPRRR